MIKPETTRALEHVGPDIHLDDIFEENDAKNQHDRRQIHTAHGGKKIADGSQNRLGDSQQAIPYLSLIHI